jgi:hypothetical protein
VRRRLRHCRSCVKRLPLPDAASPSKKPLKGLCFSGVVRHDGDQESDSRAMRRRGSDGAAVDLWNCDDAQPRRVLVEA